MKMVGRAKSRIIPISCAVVIAVSTLLSTISIFYDKNKEAYADGLSVADSLLLESIKKGLQTCLSSGILKKENLTKANSSNASSEAGKEAVVESSDSFKDSDIFNTRMDAYTKDGMVSLPYMYGTGNTLKDANLSCKQLLAGYSDGPNNSFDTYEKLGGRSAPYKGTHSIDKKNEFLEALGYTADSRNDSRAYCASLSYSVTRNGNTEHKHTSPICINTVDGKIAPSSGNRITDKDIIDPGINQNDFLNLHYYPSDDSISLILLTPSVANDSTCTPIYTQLAISKKLNSSINQSAEEFFSDLYNKINSINLGNSRPSGAPTGALSEFYTVVPDCGVSLKDAMGAESVVADISNSTRGITSTGSDSILNGSLVKRYKYTGQPDYDKLMKYYVPSYVTRPSGANQREKAYNWYYVLKDVFEGVAVDSSVGCSTVEPSNGTYLKYYRYSDSDPTKPEVQFCSIDEATLNHRANDPIMDKGEAGKVNSISFFHDDIRQITAKEALQYLNSVDLPSLCAEDSSFPLCKATPIECKDDPNKEGCKELAGNASENEDDTQNGEQAACMQNAGALGWIICPVMYGLRDTVEAIFGNAIEPLLRVHSSIVSGLADGSDSTSMYRAWSFFRDVANILFVIALLFVVFSQVTGFGIDNYGIKKILPKLIVTAIIVNFSYIICGLFVDISHIVGDSVKNIFENFTPNITIGDQTAGASNASYVFSVVSIILLILGGLFATFAAGKLAFHSGSLLAFIVPILGFVASAALAGFFAMLMLGLRQALVIIMIVISPIAFVLYAIPNTNPIFKKWLQLFKILLMLYPIYCFMTGGGFMASSLILSVTNDFFMQLIAGLISIAPYFMVPSMTKNALKGFDGAVAGLATLQGIASSGLSAVDKRIRGSEAYKSSVENGETGKLRRFMKRYDGKSNAEIEKDLGGSVGKRRRFMRAVGTLSKDAQQSAIIGAAMSQYRFNTDPANMARANISAMRGEDENQKKQVMSEFIDKNVGWEDALLELNGMQKYEYGKDIQKDHDHDIRMTALQSYLMSSKDGRKGYNRYLRGETISTASGEKIESANTRMSERARAVLSRDFVNNHADRKDEFGISFTQMYNAQGSGAIEQMGTELTTDNFASRRQSAINTYASRMEAKDFKTMGKEDANELSSVTRDNMDKITSSSITDESARSKFEDALNQFASIAQNNPSTIDELPTDVNKLVKNWTTTSNNRSGIDLYDSGNRVLVTRAPDNSVVSTARFENGTPKTPTQTPSPNQSSNPNPNQNP